MAKRMEAERSRSAALGDLLERRSWLAYVVLALRAFPMRAERPGALVLADTFAAGWYADVDDTPATILPAYDALLAVAIPAGQHIVTFSYRPAPTLVGFVLAVVVTAALAEWAVGRSRLRLAATRIRRR